MLSYNYFYVSVEFVADAFGYNFNLSVEGNFEIEADKAAAIFKGDNNLRSVELAPTDIFGVMRCMLFI